MKRRLFFWCFSFCWFVLYSSPHLYAETGKDTTIWIDEETPLHLILIKSGTIFTNHTEVLTDTGIPQISDTLQSDFVL